MVKLIAEVCQNHLGSQELLAEMIAAAAEAGADYVKMQTIYAEDLTQRDRFEEGWVEENGVRKTIKRPYAPEYERLSSLDLSEADHRFFIEECVRAGVTPFTTVFARSRIAEVAALPWPEKIVKVASYDCASQPLLRELCQHFDHLIISTGATFDDEVARAADTVRRAGKQLTLLHCVTSYPNPLAMCNLARMEWLRQFAPSVGWSDHTLVERDGIVAAKVAIALGAEWIERHFTVLPGDRSKDGPVSITPVHLRELVTFAALPPAERSRALEAAGVNAAEIIGIAQRDLTHVEMLNRDYYRGRFASRAGEKWVYNWEEHPLS